MVARISLAGYSTKEIQLTDGPINWIALNGRSHGEYWLLKAEHFHVDLQPISQVFTGGVTARLRPPAQLTFNRNSPWKSWFAARNPLSSI